MRQGRLRPGAWWCAATLFTLVCLLLPMRLRALRHDGDDEDDRDRVGLFQTMVISEGQPVDDVACAFCTIQVDGDVHGDLAVMFSTVNVAPGRTISGDVATMFSSLILGEGDRVNGDMANLLSTVSLPDSAHVQGDKAIFASGLGLGMIFAPLLIVVGLIWLLVWVVRRMSY